MKRQQDLHNIRVGWLIVAGATIPVWLAILAIAAISRGWFA